MTEAHDPHHGHGHGARPVTEEDHISTKAILLVGVGSLVVFFFASWAAVGFLQMKLGERPALPIPPEVRASKIGLVEQQIFPQANRGARERAAKVEHMRSWGWVDRERGVLHMPIERAMELTVEGVRPPPGPPPPAAGPRVGG